MTELFPFLSLDGLLKNVHVSPLSRLRIVKRTVLGQLLLIISCHKCHSISVCQCLKLFETSFKSFLWLSGLLFRSTVIWGWEKRGPLHQRREQHKVLLRHSFFHFLTLKVLLIDMLFDNELHMNTLYNRQKKRWQLDWSLHSLEVLIQFYNNKKTLLQYFVFLF